MAPPILFPYSLSTTAAPSPASTCPRRGSSSTVASLISKSPVSCEKVGSSRDSTAADGAATEFVTVTWDGPDDPQNPKNWSKGKKWATSLIISGFAFLSPLCSSIMAPALESIGSDLQITSAAERQLVLSIFLLAYAIGPFVMSPCSEVWGRVPVIRCGNTVFILFTSLCGIATSQGQIIAFRFLAGLGGSASVGMGSGVLTDCWRPEERGKGIAVYQLTQVLGPAVGPIVGGYISQYTTWRWCFFVIVLLNVTVQLIAALFLNETYAPRLLHVKARALREQTGNPMFHTQWEQSAAESQRTFSALLMKALSRPWAMLFTQPIIQLLALYQAFNFGTLYLLISGFPALWEKHYGMERGNASLNYISLAVGSLVGVMICGPATDAIYAALKRRNTSRTEGLGQQSDHEERGREKGRETEERVGSIGKGMPEYRMPLMVPASIVTPVAIFLYGWGAEGRLHFLIPNLGAGLFACSSIICYQCISAYVADAYTLHSASASAACAFLRSLLAFVFPLFVPALFGDLGYGVGGSVIACIAIVFGIPAPWIVWFWGSKMRRGSRLAVSDEVIYGVADTGVQNDDGRDRDGIGVVHSAR